MNIPFELASGRKDFREAADAGLLLWRRNFINFMPFFAIPFWICAFALKLIPDLGYWLWLILWLLKPLFDRPVLHIISVRFFEKDANMKRLRQGLWKSILRGLPGDLSWRRFSPYRSAMMPMRVLEPKPKTKLRGGVSQRKKLLIKGGVSYGFLLTIWGIAVEIMLFFGVMLFIYFMMDLFTESAYTFSEYLRNSEVYFYAIFCFNIMLVEPIYVCMGFSLYINSRIEVEGWDIEIIFRNFAEKLKEKTKSGALAVLFLLFLFMPLKTFADNDSPLTAVDNVPLEELQAILDSPELGGEKDAWGIRLKKPIEDIELPEIDLEKLARMEKLREAIAFALRLILVAAIAALIVFLFYYMRKFNFGRGGKGDLYKVKALQKIHDENPRLLLEKALSYHETGNTRLAWAYCTAAAILSWQFYRGLAFPQNATESDCANTVSSMAAAGKSFCNAEEARIFSALVNNWVYLAYAQRLPPEGSFEKAIAFCKSLEIADV